MKVTVSNPEFARQNVWFFQQPEFFEYDGEEVSVKHCTADQLALSTGDPEWPVRIISRNRIVKIDGATVSSKTSAVVTKVVKGSKGEDYIVTGNNGKWTCTCAGFQFRKSCKHISQ